MLFVAVLGPTGLVNSVARRDLGLHDAHDRVARRPRHGRWPLLIGITIWSGTGFNAILFAARLSSIDPEIYAAAELDGATHWQKMWRIAFPIALDFFGVLTMLQYLWTLFGSRGPDPAPDPRRPGRGDVDAVAGSSTTSGSGIRTSATARRSGCCCFVLGVIGLVVIRRVFRARY